MKFQHRKLATPGNMIKKKKSVFLFEIVNAKRSELGFYLIIIIIKKSQGARW